MEPGELDGVLGEMRQSEPDLLKRIIALGRRNIGQRYEIFLLGEFPFEQYDPDPIYRLDASDCVTFCEHTYAMALSGDFPSFVRSLQRIRYRDGIVGMLTRNHYTVADWDRNNAFMFEDMTTKLGDGKASVPLTQVVRRARFFAQFGIGQDIPDEPIEDSYIPKENVAGILSELRDADFVNIIRGNESSQYAGHTGLIAIGPDGTANFLHSARPVVREQPLLDYLAKDSKCLGIKILRLRPDAQRLFAAALENSPDATEVNEAALTAALAASPLASVEPAPVYSDDWKHAMKLQAYRLPHDFSPDADLQAVLERIDADVCASLGISPEQRAFGVVDLSELRCAMIEPDTMFYAASVPKIAIVAAYFETHPEAIEDLDPQVERELQRVIKRSDNELAAKYSQLVGLDAIRDMLTSKRYGLYDEKHGGGLWCGKHYGIDTPRTGDPLHDHSHGATVRQCLRYYLMLEQGRLVSAEASAAIRGIFAAPDLDFHDQGFVRGLNGRDVGILRKSGTWEDWHLDTARVQHGERVYLLAGMTRHPEGDRYLAAMASRMDQWLCGPASAVPFAHELITHDRDEDFARDGSRRSLFVAAPGDVTSYESPVIEPAFRFNEAIVSWNIDAPPSAGFCVELRVGDRLDDSWSEWLYLGDWGTALPDGPRLSSCDEGLIDVDYFRSEQRFDRLQYRIRASGNEMYGVALRIDRVVVSVSDTTGMPGASPRGVVQATRRPAASWRRRLAVPFRSQKDEASDIAHRVCSPTSVGMMLSHWGIERATAEVAQACYDSTNDIYGNWSRNVQAAYSLGVSGYLRRFSRWADVEHMIADGQPLIISVRVEEEGGLWGAPYQTTKGHLLVLTGFSGDELVTVNDPAAANAEQGVTQHRRSDLENVWMRASGGLAYVLLPTGSSVARASAAQASESK